MRVPAPFHPAGTGSGLSRRAFLLAAGGAAMVAVVGLPGPAFALSLDEARQQGLVGERRDGYIGVVRSGPGVQDLVDRVNSQRRQEYQRVAQDTNAPLAAVEARAAEQLINRLQSGWYYMNASGQWVQK